MSATTTPSGLVLVNGRKREMGGFSVARVLPELGLRSVGPFVFLDEMGPLDLATGALLSVRPHPHIGLATLTWLFEGGILHRDSLGVTQEIRPGEVNWMTAGKGVVHSERTPPRLAGQPGRIHGLQVWVALPLAEEERDPSFQHVEASEIPAVKIGEVRVTLVAGSAFGLCSPVRVYSPLFYAIVEASSAAEFALPEGHAERGLYVLWGEVSWGEERLSPGQLGRFPEGDVRVRLAAGSCVLALGGAPLDAPRHLDWNFVSSRPERIAQAREDWKNERFPLVPGDEHERIPLP